MVIVILRNSEETQALAKIEIQEERINQFLDYLRHTKVGYAIECEVKGWLRRELKQSFTEGLTLQRFQGTGLKNGTKLPVRLRES